MGSKKKKNIASETDSDSGSESSLSMRSDDSDRSSRRRSSSSSRRKKRRERERSRKDRHSHGRKRERREKRLKKSSRRDDDMRRRKRKKTYHSNSELDDSSPSEEKEKVCDDPESVVREMLKEFPSVAQDLKQLLQMIDEGQAVDIKGISERSLVKHLKKLFLSLNLDENGGVFLLPANRSAVLTSVGPLIEAHMQHNGPNLVHDSAKDVHPSGTNAESRQLQQEHHSVGPKDDAPSQRRMIGPAMPSAELLAAAAKLTEAQAELRGAELEEDDEVFIGPAPPAVVAEAESANEAERFEEVTRIMGAEADDPYDVVGVNHRMPTDQIKKRYWKLSLLVHPDKCSHPQAHQSFIKLNKAFKELQDPDKRKALDDKIKLKEEQENFMVELKAMREAAQWRKLQGISMEGDDELLAESKSKVTPTRDEWMTNLPPERKPGVTMQSAKFSKTSREGRGDTSVWTDTPSDRAKKAKMNYLEAYNEAAALASNEEKKEMSADADLVDVYNKEKRSKSLLQKHREGSSSRPKKKSFQQQVKDDWVGKHPWKPWDREKDLVAGRQSVNFDAENMAEGLTSRFSSGNFQRNFL